MMSSLNHPFYCFDSFHLYLFPLVLFKKHLIPSFLCLFIHTYYNILSVQLLSEWPDFLSFCLPEFPVNSLITSQIISQITSQITSSANSEAAP